jgi:PEP-CTERM motif
MTMKAYFSAVAPVALLAMISSAQPAQATIVATVQGAYDKDYYDTPELDFFNTSGGTLTNVSMYLYAYQPGTLNYGDSVTVPLANMGLGETDIVWGFIPGQPSSTTPNNLTAYDYDDEWGEYPSGYTNPACAAEGYSYCADVGNFRVTFTATISGGTFDGDPVYSVFSPTSNYTGGFVGWEGLDPNGVSESVYDAHSGSIGGTMAIVQIGTVPLGIPEPATWALMLIGVGGIGVAMRSARRKAVEPVPAA